ncbi:helix-turn-helix transcriptional regulator [Vreelandella gomseomensis]|uniref:AlpA family phage regulatory protein n=1 Tax=Vreelandella gomseomensis TaxID=370766 RepID=A0ABU1G8D7_9GAMM|nr:AlpA family phage regulatory protein [Halomonas gomseomensis]MDR5873752.1 AlpA family phage regulatory protein [Halomonas gomseomensis]
MTTTKQTVTILRIRQLSKKLGMSRSWIYEKINPDSPRYDPSFPKPIKLGASAIGWIEHDIDQWVMSQLV